jgi:hypothetical protein
VPGWRVGPPGLCAMPYRRHPDRDLPCVLDHSPSPERIPMTVTLAPLVSLVAGILILVMPKLLNYIVAVYLIVIGLLGLFGTGTFRLS